MDVTSTRQDAWTEDEDLMLADTVLKHIREGGTQLQAFEKVGKKVNRTAAACGFRWNSYVRKQYKAGIELAKKQRKNSLKKNEEDSNRIVKQVETEENNDKQQWKLSEVFQYLSSLNDEKEYLYEQNKALKKKVETLDETVKQMEASCEKYKHDYRTLVEDHSSLLIILDKARKLAMLEEDEHQDKIRFQMDKNGNLQRIEK